MHCLPIATIAACEYDGVEISLPKVQAIGRDRVAATLNEDDLNLYCVIARWLNEGSDVDAAVDGISVSGDLGANFLSILPPPRGVIDNETFGAWFDDIGRVAAGSGVTPIVHHHAGAHVEQPDEIRR